MWLCRHSQLKIRQTKEDGMETMVEEDETIQLVEETNKKVVHQIRDNLKTQEITEVVLQLDKEVIKENLKNEIFSVITVRSTDIMQVNIEEARNRIN